MPPALLGGMGKALGLVFLVVMGCSGGAPDDGVDYDDFYPPPPDPIPQGFVCTVDDPKGYLRPICEYIVSELRSYDIDPNDIGIEDLYEDEINATVYLDCCFTGDIAVVERATKRVVDFQLGAI